tara:strand:- start:1763 stop:1906 length:144 start_codon:yes stop_codon:yes gene_type:complete
MEWIFISISRFLYDITLSVRGELKVLRKARDNGTRSIDLVRHMVNFR